MRKYSLFLTILAGFALPACGGGGSGESNNFRLIEFLEAGQNNVPRNRQVTFRFSSPVMEEQDFSSRLRIQNVIQEEPANFARATGAYLVNGDEVVFTPKLPQLSDRSDAGFRADGAYHVFLSGGADGLQSSSGERVPGQQEFVFETNKFFEDVAPSDPPRALTLHAVDPTDDSTMDISRMDPRPFELAQIDNATLIANGRLIDPGAGGAPEYATPWEFDLSISEPIDPSTVDVKGVQLTEIFENALTTAPDAATPGHFGDLVSYKVPIDVRVIQSVDDDGNYDIRIRVRPLQTLVDNTRYRLSFSGDVLGLDFRKTFAGDNGLTGDGETIVDGSVFPEPGGLGYVTEFVVADREAVRASRTVQYDPPADGIEPELGQTTLDPESRNNSALYNPASAPGRAVGFLSAFGQGTDGPLGISVDTVLDTGDVPNEPLGNPFRVTDLNPNDDYLGNPLPGGQIEYDSNEPFELSLESLTISTSSTLRIRGVNPMLFRVTGIVQINGILDLGGADGADGGKPLSQGGTAGAGGFAGGDAGGGYSGTCYHSTNSTSCENFSTYLNACSGAAAAFPAARNGFGPGRGLAGGDGWVYYAQDNKNSYGTSGGGGASHALSGTPGEDRKNAGGALGTSGACGPSNWPTRLSSVIGVRGMPGPTYGDRAVDLVNMGGSGGGAGGANFNYQPGANFSGGAGGGGGGSVTIVAAGDILAQGAIFDVSGGDGGDGAVVNVYTASTSTNWDKVTGGGGGGAGGTLALISGGSISLVGSLVDARGGAGGARATSNCSACNAGGDGGNGFIFMMDADGEIDGFLPSDPGEYDNDQRGVLTISEFNADRFSSITAVTELFPMTAANPAYLPAEAATDIKGLVNSNQRIRIVVSSANSDLDDPLRPDLLTESAPFEVALVAYQNGATTVTITGDMRELNAVPGSPNREAFVRVQAQFDYDNSVEAALGPYASIDEFTIRYEFNG